MTDAQVLRDLAEAERIRRGLVKALKRGADQPTLERAQCPGSAGQHGAAKHLEAWPRRWPGDVSSTKLGVRDRVQLTLLAYQAGLAFQGSHIALPRCDIADGAEAATSDRCVSARPSRPDHRHLQVDAHEGRVGVVWLRERGERAAGDDAGPEHQAVRRAAELEVSELLALGDVVAGGDGGADDAGGDVRHPDRDEGDEAENGSSAWMRMTARAATCARYACEFIGSTASGSSASASE